ncbi:hypothetical protein [Flavobacterium soyangense]|uniref:LysM domain-containing protein n=1 Tax=Flavobacterium soyangense TaxID=2023265 RepID=A0A930U8C3_9FLAO|nr:hypothetical protein [Flavobacterium soyangense]MBF2708788.1 hypothetical protein [Flavobacterium soyangense]
MIDYKVYENQTLLDVSAHVYGSAAVAMELSRINSISISEKLQAGQLIQLADATITLLVKKALDGRGIIPATGFNGTIDDLIPDLGIGSTAIGSTFIVR